MYLPKVGITKRLSYQKKGTPLNCNSKISQLMSSLDKGVNERFISPTLQEKDIFMKTNNCVIVPAKVIVPTNSPWIGDVHNNYHGFNGFNEETACFSEILSPVTLKRTSPAKGTKIIHLDNFKEPGGTIAASSSLEEYIATDRLRDCACMTIKDKIHNAQTLIHCWPDENINFNKEIIEYIFENSSKEGLEINLIPGILSETSDTLAFLYDMIKKYAPYAKIKYCNFPNIKGFNVHGNPRIQEYNYSVLENEFKHRIAQADNRAVILHDGDVTCCLNFELETGNKILNPTDKLIYARML